MKFKDYYDVLGVTPTAGLREIKLAYRKLARLYHPDVSEHHAAEDRFKEVGEAYEVLKNKEKRAEYDELREYQMNGGRVQGDVERDFSDFFSSIFSSSQGASARSQRNFSVGRGQDIETDMPIFLEDTQSEETKTISYSLPYYDEQGHITETNKVLRVKIPAGVCHGERIRLKGQGTLGKYGSPNGDLYLRVRMVPHPLFDVEAHDLIITVPVSPWEAALGAKISVPTLSGKIYLTIPEGSESGARLRIKNKGLVKKTGVGDMFAVLKVVMPNDSSEASRKLWKQLEELSDFDPRSEWSMGNG